MTAVGYPKDYSYLKIHVNYIAKFNTSKKKKAQPLPYWQ